MPEFLLWAEYQDSEAAARPASSPSALRRELAEQPVPFGPWGLGKYQSGDLGSPLRSGE